MPPGSRDDWKDAVTMWGRVSESQVSAGLGLVLLFFFVDGFIRDASLASAIALVIVAVFVIIGLIRIADPTSIRRIEWHAIVTALLGTLAVAVGVRVFGLSSVFMAALVGIVAGVLPKFFKNLDASTTAPLYVGAFAGMTSPVVLLGPGWLLLAGVLTGCVWSIARDAWQGIGGKMGTVAFTGVALTSLVAAVAGNPASTPAMTSYSTTETVTILAASVVAALVTHWLAYTRGMGAILGSAVPVALISTCAWALHPLMDVPQDALITAWFGASFVGMTHPGRLAHRRWTLIAMSLLFAFLLLQFQSRLAGLGGDSGATAATAVIAIIGVHWCVQRMRTSSATL